MEPVKLAHSHGALTQFENCPKRYYYQRITKEVKDVGGEASIYGERVHRALELCIKGEAELPAEFEKYAVLCRAILSNPGATTIAEQELTVNNQLKPTGWWDSDAWVRSKLDILQIQGRRAHIFDWKTGKRKLDWSQMELCSAMTFLHYPEVMEIKSSYVWLQDMKIDTNPKTFTRGDDLVGLLLKLFPRIKRIEAALAANNWPAKPSGLCPYCPAKGICEYAYEKRGRR